MKWAFFLFISILVGFFTLLKSLFSSSDMTGLEYEHYVANYLRGRGYYNVKVTQGSGDYGIDVIATKGGIKYAVQCKYYSNPVGLHAIQEAVAGINHYSCDSAMVVTNNLFTQAAETLAEENGVVLIPNVVPGKLSFKNSVSVIYTILFILSFLGALCTKEFKLSFTVFVIGIIPYLLYALLSFIKKSKNNDKSLELIDNRLLNESDTEEIDYIDNDIFEPTTITSLDLDKLDEYLNTEIEDSSNTSDNATFSVTEPSINKFDTINERKQKENQKSETKKEKSTDNIIKGPYEESPVQKFNIINEEVKQSFDYYKIPDIDLFSYADSDKQNIIRIYDLLDTIEFISNTFNVCLGKDYDGNNIYCDLIRNPYLLIFGQTGTGKSICMNSIITSLLFETKPDEVKLLLIDPKAIEFSKYSGIPHLIIPVITDTKKGVGALGWAISEMLQRYNRFSNAGVRDIDGYNNYAANHKDVEKIPHILIFVDSLELLMLESKNETQNAICRLTATARAVGIHLIISTQQKKIIKKANINTTIKTEIAFDNDYSSETYQLLYKPSNMNEPIKIKGCLVLDEEINKLCDFIKEQEKPEYNELIQKEIEAKATPYGANPFLSEENDYDDELFEKAAEIIIETGCASTSFLQRKLSVGYAKGAKIIDQLQEYGVIGTAEGAKPRQVLMTKQMWIEKRAYDKNNS